MDSNIEHCRALGLPSIKGTGRTRLAIVGGGPSVKEYLQELRDFDGDIWIAASAYHWCRYNGIDGRFMAVGPEAIIAKLAVGAEKAILSSCVDPSVFEVLKDADVQVFDLVSDGPMMNHGPSTVTAAFVQAIKADYREVTFYGCDSCYTAGGNSHAYEDSKHDYRIGVTVGADEFYTEALLLLQAEYMAKMISTAPHVFKEKSGGLLRALIGNPDYYIVSGTKELHEFIKQAA